MPVFLLQVKCDLENVAKLYYDERTVWKFDITSGNGEERKGITVQSSDIIELSGSKGIQF